MFEKKSLVHKEVVKGLLFLVSIYLFNSFIYSEKLNEEIANLIIRENGVDGGSILTQTYVAYIMFFLKIGHLLLFIYLAKSLRGNLKKFQIYLGVIYFSLGIFFENIGSIIYFESLSKGAFILGICFYILGILKFLNYFIYKTFDKSGRRNLLEAFLVIASSLFLSFSRLEIQSLKSLFNMYLSGVFLFLILSNIILTFYRKSYFEKKETLILTVLFALEFTLYTILSRVVQLDNFEVISLIVLNFVVIDLRREEYQSKKDVEYGVNINYIRILLIFLMIGIFSKAVSISGLLTLFLITLIIGELIFFTLTTESDYSFKIYNLLLNKAKLIETGEKMVLFLEDELTRYFRLVDIKVILYPASIEVKDGKEEYISFNIEYEKNRYDLEVRMVEIGREVGKIYIKDSCMILNRKKLKKFLFLLEKLTPILENLALKEVQVGYYKSNKNEILEKLEELEKENYYLKEIIKLNDKKGEI